MMRGILFESDVGRGSDGASERVNITGRSYWREVAVKQIPGP